MQFLEVSKSFQDQQIDTALSQCLDLFAECLTCFLKRSFSQRFDSRTQRANRSSDPHIESLGGFSRQRCTHPVHITYLVGQAMPGEPEGVRAKSIGFNNFRTGL